jgi:predicted Holliday junction resolvase-like endonuclease
MIAEAALIFIIILLLQLIWRTESIEDAIDSYKSGETIRERPTLDKIQQRKIHREILGYIESRDKKRKEIEEAYEKKQKQREQDIAKSADLVRQEMVRDINLKITVADAMGNTELVNKLVKDLESIS